MIFSRVSYRLSRLFGLFFVVLTGFCVRMFLFGLFGFLQARHQGTLKP